MDARWKAVDSDLTGDHRNYSKYCAYGAATIMRSPPKLTVRRRRGERVRNERLSALPPGASVLSHQHQELDRHYTEGLWCAEEVLFAAQRLADWRARTDIRLVLATRVASGLSRVVSVREACESDLLHDILMSAPAARADRTTLNSIVEERILPIAISYKHTGPKGEHIDFASWQVICKAAAVVAVTGGYEGFSLWVDTISSIGVQAGTKLVVDWFEIGVMPYISLPVIVTAAEELRERRLWLRLEEVLGDMNVAGFYAVQSQGNLIRIAPNEGKSMTFERKLGLLAGSVERGEFNDLRREVDSDYASLLKWGVEYHATHELRGLTNTDSTRTGHSVSQVGARNPVCRVIVKVPQLKSKRWLYGMESFAGQLELLQIEDRPESSIAQLRNAGLQRSERDQTAVRVYRKKGQEYIAMMECLTTDLGTNIETDSLETSRVLIAYIVARFDITEGVVTDIFLVPSMRGFSASESMEFIERGDAYIPHLEELLPINAGTKTVLPIRDIKWKYQ